MARSVSTALRSKGYEAPVAADEPTAMAMADAVTPRLIVVDLTSTGLADSSLISDIRRSSELERVPIVVLTTRVDMPDRRVQASVLVPIEMGELLAAVAALLPEQDPPTPTGPPSRTSPPQPASALRDPGTLPKRSL
jgi:DNA-binding response OmpR family regulator